MTDLLRTDREPRGPTASVTSRLLAHRATMPVLFGMVGLTISLVGIAVPSVWYDEAATITSATRTWPQLLAELRTVDAVHGVYYALIHLIFDVFGYTPLAMRVPSAIAVGLAAALVVVLGRQLATERIAVLSAFVFVLLPRVTWLGTEARSYAISVLLAVLLTIVCVRATRSTSKRWWVIYGALAAVGTLVFVYLALIIAAHAIALGWWWLSDRRAAKRSVVRWAIASGSAAVALIPFALVVIGQSGQLVWIPSLSLVTLGQVFQGQWFRYSTPFALIGWTLIIAGAVELIRRARRFEGFAREQAIRVAAVVLPALALPTLALLVATVLFSPLYTPRYVAMSLPFVAIAIAVALDAILTRKLFVVTLALIVVAAIPEIVTQRLPLAKENTSWAQVAEFIASERANDGPGSRTAMIWGRLPNHVGATTRVVQHAYPDAFAGTVDVTLKTSGAESGRLWELYYPIGDSLDRLRSADVAYLVTSTENDWRPETATALATVGWRVTDSWTISEMNIVRYERG